MSRLCKFYKKLVHETNKFELNLLINLMFISIPMLQVLELDSILMKIRSKINNLMKKNWLGYFWGYYRGNVNFSIISDKQEMFFHLI